MLDRGTASSSFSQPKSGELKLFHDQIVTSIPEEFRTNYFSSLIYRFSSTHEFELLSTFSPTLNDSYEIKQVSQAFAEGSLNRNLGKALRAAKNQFAEDTQNRFLKHFLTNSMELDAMAISNAVIALEDSSQKHACVILYSAVGK